MHRKMALDLGDARIGIAVSDLMGIIVSEQSTYHRKNLNADIAHIVGLVTEKRVDTIVIGLPINMDGTKGVRVDKTYAFGEELAKVTQVKLEYIDERLTTVAAEKMLISADVRREKRKEVIDAVSANIILQSYLDKIK